MKFLNYIKQLFLFLLIFLLGVKTTYAKTELILPQTAVSFSTENTQSFTSLEKDELHIPSVLHSVDKNIVDILPAEDLRKYVNEEYIKHRLAKKLGEDGRELASFINKSLADKLKHIDDIWKTKYPIPDMLGGRSFFEDVMGQYRYTKASGWEHTGDISFNVKGIDFYKGTEKAGIIDATTAVSMKTTIQTNVETWLKYPSIQDNIKFLREGMSSKGMLDPNNSLKMFIENAEIHIYMKKSNISPSLKAEWLNKLSADYPDIKFEIKVIEDFIN